MKLCVQIMSTLLYSYLLYIPTLGLWKNIIPCIGLIRIHMSVQKPLIGLAVNHYKYPTCQAMAMSPLTERRGRSFLVRL